MFVCFAVVCLYDALTKLVATVCVTQDAEQLGPGKLRICRSGMLEGRPHLPSLIFCR